MPPTPTDPSRLEPAGLQARTPTEYRRLCGQRVVQVIGRDTNVGIRHFFFMVRRGGDAPAWSYHVGRGIDRCATITIEEKGKCSFEDAGPLHTALLWHRETIAAGQRVCSPLLEENPRRTPAMTMLKAITGHAQTTECTRKVRDHLYTRVIGNNCALN